ncbi:methyl-CpG-binding domain-containing protein 9-like [Dorcoceras hygrometricum]|uniref:Methyl-CpG-binding domain-containing protein 9-like n=1 Tax=Dorcoceras hygrometricum TaxID=472368 RepID=A0A2Z7C270_9LAMI|nr:methyl-CpG-binding domain-containing protein 9-like [Dorcoceras hygrometricum]
MKEIINKVETTLRERDLPSVGDPDPPAARQRKNKKQCILNGNNDESGRIVEGAGATRCILNGKTKRRVPSQPSSPSVQPQHLRGGSDPVPPQCYPHCATSNTTPRVHNIKRNMYNRQPNGNQLYENSRSHTCLNSSRKLKQQAAARSLLPTEQGGKVTVEARKSINRSGNLLQTLGHPTTQTKLQ